MSANPNIESHGQATLKWYESNGLLIGLALGLVVGVIISGPNFHDWSSVTSLIAIAVCTIGASSTAGNDIGLGSGPDFGGHSGSDSGSSGGGDDGAGGSD
jgi:hypothetical protein